MKRVKVISIIILIQTLAMGLAFGKTKPTISGLSSGAMMTAQFQLAFPELISGAGIVAGGIPGCAVGNPFLATEICLKNPGVLVTANYIQQARLENFYGQIGNLDLLKNHKTFVFSSPKDTVVNYPMGEKLNEFYAAFVPSVNYKMVDTILSEHAMPTDSQGASCETKAAPFVNNCGYDTAGEMFKFFYGPLKAKVKAKAKNLRPFNQLAFASPAFIADVGYVYTPDQCKKNKSLCRVHMALHGCLQSYEEGDNSFARMSGYNEWAESNNIIVVYPSTKKTTFNPNGCWDWWGYTGMNYHYRSATQIGFLKKVVEHFDNSVMN